MRMVSPTLVSDGIPTLRMGKNAHDRFRIHEDRKAIEKTVRTLLRNPHVVCFGYLILIGEVLFVEYMDYTHDVWAVSVYGNIVVKLPYAKVISRLGSV